MFDAEVMRALGGGFGAAAVPPASQLSPSTGWLPGTVYPQIRISWFIKQMQYPANESNVDGFDGSPSPGRKLRSVSCRRLVRT